jgi:putative salt-induced outer membrane protein
MKKYALLGGCLLLASTPIFAAEDGIKSSVEVGVVLTSGNTETRTGNLKGKAEQTKGKFRNTVAAEALYVDGDQGKLSEKYLGSGKSAYQFGKHSYGFVTATLERDLFSGYDYQASISAGYGYRVIDSKEMTLDFEAGPGYRRNKPDNTDAEGELIGRLAGLFAYRFNKTATFTEELVSEIGTDGAITKSVTALTAQIVGNMAMKASLTARHNSSDLPAGVEAMDTETALTLVYTF